MHARTPASIAIISSRVAVSVKFSAIAAIAAARTWSRRLQARLVSPFSDVVVRYPLDRLLCISIIQILVVASSDTPGPGCAMFHNFFNWQSTSPKCRSGKRKGESKGKRLGLALGEVEEYWMV